MYWPKKNVAYTTVIKLFPTSGEWLASPTIASGDFKRVGYSSAGAVTLAIGNPTTLPAIVESGSGDVVIILSSTEMNHDVVVVSWKDASGAEWQSGALVLPTTADGVDDVTTVTDTVLANVMQINSDSPSAVKLGKSSGTIETGAAIAGTLSTTQMSTDLTEATNDHYKDRVIIWTTGTLARQAAAIVAYNGTTKVLTFTQTTEAPVATDQFIII